MKIDTKDKLIQAAYKLAEEKGEIHAVGLLTILANDLSKKFLEEVY